MKTLRLVSAALTLGAIAACPVLAQDTMDNTGGTGGTSRGMMGSMSGGTDMMTGMSDRDRYRARWVYYNLDEQSIRRYRSMGLDETSIRGAANIALRTGLDMGYVVRRLQVTGLPLAALALQLNVPATAVVAEIPGMGQSSADMYNTMMGGMSGGGMGTGGGMGGTGTGTDTGTGTGGTGTGTGGTGTGGDTGTGGTGTGTGGTGTGGDSGTGTGTGTGGDSGTGTGTGTNP